MKIVTDSAADLTPAEIAELGIDVVPLFIQFPEGEVSSEEISSDRFYDRLRAMRPQIPSTSQPSSGMFMNLYEKLIAGGEQILSIHISSGLSGTIEAARAGARTVGSGMVTMVDTMTLSGGQRFQVLAASLAARAGWGVQAILDRLEKIRTSTEVVYTLETLEYLARGGRIGRVQALAGSLLKLKPIIRVDKADGKYSTAGKERTMQRSIERIVDTLLETYGPDTPLWVSVLHGQFAEQASVLSDRLREKLNVARLEVLRISPVLGVHTGPAIVGAAAVPVSLMEDF